MLKHIITLQGDACKGAYFLHAIEYSIINDSELHKILTSHGESTNRMPYPFMEAVIKNHLITNNNDQTSQQANSEQARELSIELGHHYKGTSTLQFTNEEIACFSGMINEIIEG
jgi:hypothetical protein